MPIKSIKGEYAWSTYCCQIKSKKMPAHLEHTWLVFNGYLRNFSEQQPTRDNTPKLSLILKIRKTKPNLLYPQSNLCDQFGKYYTQENSSFLDFQMADAVVVF